MKPSLLKPSLLSALTLLLATSLALTPATAAPARVDALADTTPPSITVDLRASDGTGPWVGWYQDAVTAMLRATDDGGIARLSYRLVGAQSGEGGLAGSLLPVTISAEGLTTIEITATDTAGNTATRQWGVGVDRTDPTATVTGISDWEGVPRNERRPVGFSCADPGGGIVSCTATNDGAPFVSGSPSATSEEGEHLLVVTATDRVGRTIRRTINYRVTRYTLLTPPVIEGNPTTVKIGQRLRASGATFHPAPGSFTYRWLIDGRAVANGDTYTPRAEHRGRRISVQAFCSNAGPGFGHQTSTVPVGNVLVQAELRMTRQTSIDGPSPARPGDRLVATVAVFTPAPRSITYRWYADDRQVGAGSDYTVQPGDTDKTISVEAVGLAPSAEYLDTSGGRVDAVRVLPDVFENPSSPTVTGAAEVGGTLTMADGSVEPVTEPAGRAWLVDDVVVGTGDRLAVTGAQAGRRVSCHQVFSRPGYADLVLPCVFPSGATSVVIPIPRGGGGPEDPGTGEAWTVTTPAGTKGTARVGKRLRVVRPGLSAPASGWSYQWLRNGKRIKGATQAAYRVRKADRKRRISVRATATSATGAVLVSTASARRIRR